MSNGYENSPQADPGFNPMINWRGLNLWPQLPNTVPLNPNDPANAPISNRPSQPDLSTLTPHRFGDQPFSLPTLSWPKNNDPLNPLQPKPAETGELPRKFWPPTNTTPGTMQWPDSTNFPKGLPGNLPRGPGYRPEDDPRFTAPNPYGAGMPRGTTLTSVPPAVAARPSAPTAAAPAPAPAPAAPSSVNLGYGVPNDRFGTFQYNVPGSPGAAAGPMGMGRGGQNTSPIYTALNLGGGGQPQPANAPANVPAPNAQPVSATTAPMGPTYQRGWKGPSAAQQANQYGWPFNMLGTIPGPTPNNFPGQP